MRDTNLCRVCGDRIGSSPTGDWCNRCGWAVPGYHCDNCGRDCVNEYHLSPGRWLCLVGHSQPEATGSGWEGKFEDE